MARINIEDSLLRDERFFRLAIKLGSRECAIGALYFAWDLAQKWWWQDDSRIPLDEWMRINFANEILECNLAEESNGRVYVCGSEDQFAWINQRREAGRLGGLAKSGGRLAVANGRLAKVSKTYSSSSSSSSSSKKEKKEKTIVQADARTSHVFDFDQIYQEYPRKQGKQRGLNICKTQIKTPDDFEKLRIALRNYQAYLQKNCTEAKYIKLFSTFMGEWRDWLDSATGSAVDQSPAINWDYVYGRTETP